MKRFPSGTTKKDNSDKDLDSSNNWVQTSENYLEESGKKETQSTRKQKKRKLNVLVEGGIEGVEDMKVEDCTTGNGDHNQPLPVPEGPGKIIAVPISILVMMLVMSFHCETQILNLF